MIIIIIIISEMFEVFSHLIYYFQNIVLKCLFTCNITILLVSSVCCVSSVVLACAVCCAMCGVVVCAWLFGLRGLCCLLCCVWCFGWCLAVRLSWLVLFVVLWAITGVLPIYGPPPGYARVQGACLPACSFFQT